MYSLTLPIKLGLMFFSMSSTVYKEDIKKIIYSRLVERVHKGLTEDMLMFLLRDLFLSWLIVLLYLFRNGQRMLLSSVFLN